MSHILNRDKYWESVSISPWLQGEALTKSTALKQQCRQLNNDEAPLKNGKRQYINIRGRQIKRSNDGRLQPVSNAIDYGEKSKSVSNSSVGEINPSCRQRYPKQSKEDERQSEDLQLVKKLPNGREPCGSHLSLQAVSLRTVMDASNRPSSLRQSLITSRNANVDKQLRSHLLRTEEVASDGNCFFQSISVCLHGDLSHHAELRQMIAKHVRDNYVHIFSMDGAAIDCEEAAWVCAENISINGTWAAEEVILASTSYMQRDILVYMTVNKISPIVCSPILIGPKLQPIRVIFFEPGHYCISSVRVL